MTGRPREQTPAGFEMIESRDLTLQQSLDLLHGLAAVTETSKPFQVISGYRSPATNEMLRHRSEGVAAGSLHMRGQAIDIRLADVPLAGLRHAALSARRTALSRCSLKYAIGLIPSASVK